MFDKQQLRGSRRRLVVIWLMLGFAAIVVANAQETVTAEADTATAASTSTTTEDATLTCEDYIDLDDVSEANIGVTKESADTTTETAKTTEATVSEDKTEASSTETPATPEINQVADKQEEVLDIVQKGPFIDLLGPTLLSLVLTGENTARFEQNLTNDALSGKSVVGLYFSADWCGPCRQFTPELVRFYDKMNAKRGKKDQFQIVWISRCRDVNAYTQYLAQMPWIALPPEEAMGARGQMLGDKFGVKGIPSLVLLDDLGSVITKDARNMVPKDMNGIGFPWRNPLATLYITIIPRSLRLMIKTHIDTVTTQVFQRIKSVVAPRPKTRTA